MKRYKKLKVQIPIREPGGFGAIEVESKMVEHPEGEWVKWEDIQDYIHDYRNAIIKPRRFYSAMEDIKDIKKRLEQLEKDCDCCCPQPDCNCAERAASCTHNPLHTWWVCPAHGYKRR